MISPYKISKNQRISNIHIIIYGKRIIKKELFYSTKLKRKCYKIKFHY